MIIWLLSFCLLYLFSFSLLCWWKNWTSRGKKWCLCRLLFRLLKTKHISKYVREKNVLLLLNEFCSYYSEAQSQCASNQFDARKARSSTQIDVPRRIYHANYWHDWAFLARFSLPQWTRRKRKWPYLRQGHLYFLLKIVYYLSLGDTTRLLKGGPQLQQSNRSRRSPQNQERRTFRQNVSCFLFLLPLFCSFLFASSYGFSFLLVTSFYSENVSSFLFLSFCFLLWFLFLLVTKFFLKINFLSENVSIWKNCSKEVGHIFLLVNNTL